MLALDDHQRCAGVEVPVVDQVGRTNSGTVRRKVTRFEEPQTSIAAAKTSGVKLTPARAA
ncbi:hypothetical protein ACM01_39705 [Streptomyces viridochromogenes]|uniref:Uncharacterized protein n=1 Tax=Streptomyces viridochromogenes TaxID=1938 RepID=A0A0J7YXK5_STRVR|nr:hypothetical protein ACM01_39705 [Streptomyces viridochromogenes]KOG08769.1 hypothetical protein ADK35_40915 [Streptomyces viridochromogenes]KOG09111.1 hypothetical protein ADK36_41650 [Streptomyces viridochromogenes]